MKCIFIFALFICLQFHSTASGSNPFTTDPAAVGDFIPLNFEMQLFYYNSHQTHRAKLGDYKGKLILLDMWANSCAACIESFTHLEAIQTKYKDKIQIFLVNSSDSLAKIRLLLNRREKAIGQSLSIPIVYSDSTIGWKLFKHSSIPHIAWINMDGRVLSITDQQEITEKNIDELLNGKQPQMVQKDDDMPEQLHYDSQKPYFIAGNISNGEQIKWYSVLAGYTEGLPRSGGITDNYKSSMIIANNLPVKDLYQLAYSDVPYYRHGLPPQTQLPNCRTIISVKDSSRLIQKINGVIIPENLYVYQLIAPPGTPYTKLQSKMKIDLNSFFNLDVRMEKRKIPCFVISADDTTSIGYKTGTEYFRIDDYAIKLNKVRMNKFLWFLNFSLSYSNMPFPIIDETGFKGELGNLEIEGNILDYHYLNVALKKFNMHFTLEEREVNVMVIRDPQ